VQLHSLQQRSEPRVAAHRIQDRVDAQIGEPASALCQAALDVVERAVPVFQAEVPRSMS
jgi:hypothetical protein